MMSKQKTNLAQRTNKQYSFPMYKLYGSRINWKTWRTVIYVQISRSANLTARLTLLFEFFLPAGVKVQT